MKSPPRSTDTRPPPAEPVVYVVDDDISVRESLGNLLRSVGLKVELFASALDFRNHPLPQGPSCLVLDVRLPGMSGLDLQQEQNRLGTRIPVIFITGHGDVPMSVRAMKAGAVEFLQKPFREQDLLDAIHAALAAAPSAAETPLVAAPIPRPGTASPADAAPRHALGRNIQIGRAIFGWSQEQLGSRCGLHRSHISALEREELSVGVDAIDQVAAAFAVAPHVLLMPSERAQSVILESFNRSGSSRVG